MKDYKTLSAQTIKSQNMGCWLCEIKRRRKEETKRGFIWLKRAQKMERKYLWGCRSKYGK